MQPRSSLHGQTSMSIHRISLLQFRGWFILAPKGLGGCYGSFGRDNPPPIDCQIRPNFPTWRCQSASNFPDSSVRREQPAMMSPRKLNSQPRFAAGVVTFVFRDDDVLCGCIELGRSPDSKSRPGALCSDILPFPQFASYRDWDHIDKAPKWPSSLRSLGRTNPTVAEARYVRPVVAECGSGPHEP